MYDATGMRADMKRESWKLRIEYETAIFVGPSGCQLMLVAERLTAFGSRKTASPLALGGSPEWSLASPAKYSS